MNIKKENLIICFFGIYNPEYARNRVLMGGLRQNEAQVIECRSNEKGIKKYFDLIKKHRQIKNQYDILFVAFPGYQVMILAWFLTRKKIIFDAFASIYDSEVCDRKTTKAKSLKAKYFWFLNWLSCKLADKVLLDTNEHIKYFVQEFGLKKEKFERIFVGTDDEIFKPISKEKGNNKFIVHFHGTNIPLQGIKYILESAKMLEKYQDIQFNITGTKTKNEYKNQKFLNVNFIDNILYEKLSEQIAQADICLGIFGDTNKTQRVIPNKVYECVACKKPVITADTPAIRELFDENDLMLIPIANPEVLAMAVLTLKQNFELGEKIAQNSYNKFQNNCTPCILGEKLIKIIESLI